MLKLAQIGVLAAVVLLLLACSDPTPTPTATLEPTPTPVPTNTPVPTPTPTPEPTSTPVPTPTPAPTAAAERDQGDDAASGQLAPLSFDDPAAIADELSPSELACMTEAADIDRLTQLLEAPDLATPEEQAQIIGCLEDETIMRMFLAGLIGETGPLSEETSTCIRGGMASIDMRSVMMAGMGGDEEAAMIGGMSAMFLTMSCLNEEEFEAAAPALDMTPEDRESLECILERLGGPEGMAEVLAGQEEAAFMALFGAAMGCDLQMEGSVTPGG